MYDSDSKLKEQGLIFLLKEHQYINDVHKNTADEICLEFIKTKRKEFSRPDIITAGTIVLHLIKDGYLDSIVLDGRGLIVTISEKGKDYIIRNGKKEKYVIIEGNDEVLNIISESKLANYDLKNCKKITWSNFTKTYNAMLHPKKFPSDYNFKYDTIVIKKIPYSKPHTADSIFRQFNVLLNGSLYRIMQPENNSVFNCLHELIEKKEV